MKKDYISPQADVLLLKMEHGVCQVSTLTTLKLLEGSMNPETIFDDDSD